MECREFQKSISTYLTDKLCDSDLNDFLNHTERCEKCREELELEYIVKKGPEIIDTPGADYDITANFRENLEEGGRYIRFRKKFLVLRYIMDTLVFWSLFFSLIKVIGIITQG